MGSPGAPGVLSRGGLTSAAVAGGLAVVTAWVLLQPAPLALGGDNETLHHPLFVDVLRQLGEARLPLWTTAGSRIEIPTGMRADVTWRERTLELGAGSHVLS